MEDKIGEEKSMTQHLHNPDIIFDGTNPSAAKFIMDLANSKNCHFAEISIILLDFNGPDKFGDWTIDLVFSAFNGQSIHRRDNVKLTREQFDNNFRDFFIQYDGLITGTLQPGLYCIEIDRIDDDAIIVKYYDGIKDKCIDLFHMTGKLTDEQIREEVHNRYPADRFYIQFWDDTNDEWKSSRLHHRHFKVTSTAKPDGVDDEVTIEEKLHDDTKSEVVWDETETFATLEVTRTERWHLHGTYEVPNDESTNGFTYGLLEEIVTHPDDHPIPDGHMGDAGGDYTILTWNDDPCINNVSY